MRLVIIIIIIIDIPIFVYTAANNFPPFRVYCLRQRFPGCPTNIPRVEYITGVRRRYRYHPTTVRDVPRKLTCAPSHFTVGRLP